MNTVVIYKSKYGSTKQYAYWIAEELSCDISENKGLKIDDILKYDNIILGGGLYAEVINGITLINKNLNLLGNKKIAVFSTGITPLECKYYYDTYVVKKNFKNGIPDNVKIFNFLGKMLTGELTFAHKTALKSLKKIMSSKENPSEMEKLLIDLCDVNADLTDKSQIYELIEYIRG